jgi:hypothetical protein
MKRSRLSRKSRTARKTRLGKHTFTEQIIDKVKAMGYTDVKASFDPKKRDSLLYGNDEQVLQAKKDGIIFSVEAHGDIRTNEGNDYTNTGMPESEYERLKKGEIELVNNNWFEVLTLQPGSNEWESSLGNVAYDLSEIPGLLDDSDIVED